jgi:hypothetical protein
MRAWTVVWVVSLVAPAAEFAATGTISTIAGNPSSSTVATTLGQSPDQEAAVLVTRELMEAGIARHTGRDRKTRREVPGPHGGRAERAGTELSGAVPAVSGGAVRGRSACLPGTRSSGTEPAAASRVLRSGRRYPPVESVPCRGLHLGLGRK